MWDGRPRPSVLSNASIAEGGHPTSWRASHEMKDPMDFESTDLIGLGPRGHLRALERLWLLYRAPHRFRAWLEQQSVCRQFAQEGCVWLHFQPHLLSICVLAQYLMVVIGLRKELRFEVLYVAVNTAFVALIVHQLLASVITRRNVQVRIAYGITFGIAVAVAIATAYGVTAGLPYGIGRGFVRGFAVGIAFGVTIGTAPRITTGIAFGLAVGVAFGFAVGIDFGIAGGLAVGIAALRAYHFVPHLAFVWPLPMGAWYRWHPVAWDQLSSLPYPRFDRLLVSYFEHDSVGAEAEIERLISTYPSQRPAALKARCRIIARRTGQVAALAELSSFIVQLPDGSEKSLAQVPDVVARVSAIVSEDAELRRLPPNMPAFRFAQAERVCEAITQFRDQIAGFAEPLSSEFREAALHWLKLAETQLADERRAADREPFPSVFRAGDPVAGEKAEAFLPRTRVVEELIQLVLATNGCPGIQLYARRRMGKSTCLQNLMGFIPSNVEVVFLNLQSAQTSGSLALFCEHVREAIEQTTTTRGGSLTPSPRYSGERVGVRGHFNQAEDLGDDGTSLESPSPSAPLPRVPGRGEQGSALLRDSRDASSLLADFERFLDEANRHYERAGRRLLIALDEYEYLDRKLGERDEDDRPLISEDLLGLLRTSIQTHRHLIWLFSGSHRITELKHAEWPSYFISLRTVELDRFTLAETSQLLTDPVKYSRLFQGEKAAKRPQFPPEFWGHNGLQRLHEAADGWPHLVVLLAETCVNLANQRNAPDISDELWIDVRQRAIESGENVMIQLLKNESEIPGEWEYLLGFRGLPDHAPLAEPDSPAVKKSLLRRSLVEFENGQARMRVPLMQQWLRERSHWLD